MKLLAYFLCFCALLTPLIAYKPLEKNELSAIDLRANEINYRLPNNTKPLHYNISLVTFIDRGEFNFSGVVNINLTVLENSNNITLHARQLTTQTVQLRDSRGSSVNGVTFTYDITREFLTISTGQVTLPRGQTYDLQISYTGELRTDMGGFYRSSYINEKGNKVWLATTQFESTNARHGFPCYDEPAIKANFTIHIRHGAAYSAVSNMPANSQNNADGSVTTHFETTPMMSTYLIAFIVSDFEYKKNNGKEFVHRVFSTPKDVCQTPYALAEGEAILNAIANYVEVPFSLPKMDQFAIPDFKAGAMENWGLVTYREQYLLWNKYVHIFSRQTSITTIISHEFGHQWFGNLVSPKWWNYIWLNEGFATLFEHIGTDVVHPDWKIFDQFVVSDLQGAFQFDAGESTRPMTFYIESPEGIANLFDTIIYAKAGSVLRMFLHAFTEASFKKALTYYLNEKAYQAADENDLFAALERAVKEDKTLDSSLTVNTIFGSWSRQKGFPLLKVTRNYEDGVVTLNQERYTTIYPHPEANQTSWWIPYNFVFGKNSEFTETKPKAWFPAGSTSVKIPSNPTLTNDDWIVFNKHHTGYYRVLYDEKNYQLIAKELNSGDHSKIHHLNRAQLIDDLKDFASTGRVSFKVFFDLISYLKKEGHYAPWAAAKKAIDDLDNTLLASDKRKQFHSFVASLVEPIYRELGLYFDDNEPHLNKYLYRIVTVVACKYGVKMCLDDTYVELKHILRTGKVLSQNSRSPIYAYGIQSANELEVDSVWSRFENSQNTDERKEIIAAFGNVKNVTILKRYLNKSIQPSERYDFTKAERLSLVQSIAYGSQYGLSTVIAFLKENIADASKQIGSINSLLKNLASRIVTSGTHDELSKLLQVAKSSNVSSDKDIEDMHGTISKKLNWIKIHQSPVESGIPPQSSTSSSYRFTVKISIVAIALLFIFALN